LSRRYGEVEGLPPPADDTTYIVSALAAQAAWAQERFDVVCPGDPVRDSAGAVIGAKSLCCAPNLPESRDLCGYCRFDNGPINRFSVWGAKRQGFDCGCCNSN